MKKQWKWLAGYYSMESERNQELPLMVRVGRTGSGWRVLEYHYDQSPA